MYHYNGSRWSCRRQKCHRKHLFIPQPIFVIAYSIPPSGQWKSCQILWHWSLSNLPPPFLAFPDIFFPTIVPFAAGKGSEEFWAIFSLKKPLSIDGIKKCLSCPNSRQNKQLNTFFIYIYSTVSMPFPGRRKKYANWAINRHFLRRRSNTSI